MISCEIVDAEGKPQFGFHPLRHSAASQFIERGWTAKKVQALLGHSAINMFFMRKSSRFVIRKRMLHKWRRWKLVS